MVALVAVVALGSWQVLGENVVKCTQDAAAAIEGSGGAAVGGGPCVGTGPRPPQDEGTTVVDSDTQQREVVAEQINDLIGGFLGFLGLGDDDDVSAGELAEALQNPDEVVVTVGDPLPGTVETDDASRARREAIAREMVVRSGSLAGDDATRAEEWVENEVVNQIPAALLELLQSQGIRIKVGKDSVADVYPELADDDALGHHGASWKDLQGAFWDEQRTVVIAVSIDEQGNVSLPTDYMLAHEIAHAIDHTIGLSNDPAFLAALEKDVAAAGGADKFAGYQHDPVEALAEILAHYFRGDAAYSKVYSNVYGWLKTDPMSAGKPLASGQHPPGCTCGKES